MDLKARGRNLYTINLYFISWILSINYNFVVYMPKVFNIKLKLALSPTNKRCSGKAIVAQSINFYCKAMCQRDL